MARDKPPVNGSAPRLTAEILIQAYAQGVFPMADGPDIDDIFWVDPRQRGILPLDGFHGSRSLRRRIRARPFGVSFNQDFAGVVQGCADRDETWINRTIAALYSDLHQAGAAHSIEIWDDGALVGGVYGVTLGAAFFGESMFSRRTDASKIALAYLVDRLRLDGFQLFDTQFLTDHLARLGAIEIPRAAYRARLDAAMGLRAQLDTSAPIAQPDQLLQRMTQTS